MKVRLQQFLAIMGQARQHCSTSWLGLQHHLQERPLCLDMTLGEKTCLLSKLLLRPECRGLKCRCSKWRLKVLLNGIIPTPAATLILGAAIPYFCWCIYYVIFYKYFVDVYAMGWMIQSSDPGRDKRFSVLKNVADQLWGLPSITFNGYWS
jgi:hypothetical protein